jgi:O-antigen/teichoic acid export membrane protein
MSSNHKFIGSGIILTLDLFVISFGNWIFWLLVSMIASPAEIGQATSVYSYILLFSSITMLGLEYTIIKKSSTDKTFVFGTTIVLKLLILFASLPLFIVLLNQLGYSLYSEITYIAIGIFVFSSFRYVFRYILLGNFESAKIFLINTIGLLSQLVIGFYLVLNNFGSTGILISFLVNVLVITVLFLFSLKRKLNLKLGNKEYFADFIKDALINFPPQLTRSLIFYFSVVLLAFLGVSESDIGLFYIAMMMSIIAGGLAGNMALMLIPSSLVANKNLSFDGLRISLALTAPIVAILLCEPEGILGIIGPHYTQATDLLIIFSLSIIPYVIVTNSVTNFNNLNQSLKIILMGAVQFGTFLSTFLILVPIFGTVGGAYSILISMCISSIFSILWYGSSILKIVLLTCFSILVAFVINLALSSVVEIHLIYSIVLTLTITLFLNIVLKNITFKELKEIIYIARQIIKKEKDDSATT